MTGMGSGVAQTAYTSTIYDPTLFLNMVRVDPTVDRELRNTAKSPKDGLIRISSQTWTQYQTSISVGIPSFEYQIPIRVSSLKAIYFTFAKQAYTGVETYHDFLSCRLGTDMKTTWFDNGLLQYQFYVDGKPSPATPVQVNKGYSEVVSELARSLQIGHKGADGMYLSLLTQNNMDDYRSRNFLMGMEFESFNSKGPIIESSYNTLNSTITLRLDFDNTGSFKNVPPAVTVGGNSAPTYVNTLTNGYYNLNGPIACYLKVFCLHDCFLTMDDDTGVMRTEI